MSLIDEKMLNGEEDILNEIQDNVGSLYNGYKLDNLIFLLPEYVEETKIIELNNDNLPSFRSDYNRYIFKNLIHTTNSTSFEAIYLLERVVNIYTLRIIQTNMQTFGNDFNIITNFIKTYIFEEMKGLNVDTDGFIDRTFFNRLSIQLEVYIPSEIEYDTLQLFTELHPHSLQNNVNRTIFGEDICNSTKLIFDLVF